MGLNCRVSSEMYSGTCGIGCVLGMCLVFGAVTFLLWNEVSTKIDAFKMKIWNNDSNDLACMVIG